MVLFVWMGTRGYNGRAKIREGERRRKSPPMVHQWWQREADAAMRAAAIRRGEARPRCARTRHNKEGRTGGGAGGGAALSASTMPRSPEGSQPPTTTRVQQDTKEISAGAASRGGEA